MLDADRELIERIRHRLAAGTLPGAEGQYRMAHVLRKNYGKAPATSRRASVLALLYPKDEVLTLLLIQRTSPAGDRHAGQIGFPGGSVEDGDRDAAHTALREANEEVGIDPDAVDVLGELSPLYIPVSEFLVNPFVGLVEQPPALQLQESEVARVLELPFRAFLDPASRIEKEIELTSGLVLRDVPHYRIGEELVWGATAMMIAELTALLEA